MRKLVVACCAVLLVVVVASCGSGGSDAESTTPPVADSGSPSGETTGAGESPSLPDGWPEDLPPPDSVTITDAGTNVPEAGYDWNGWVSGTSELGVPELFEATMAQLTAAGYTVQEENLQESGESSIAAVNVGSDGVSRTNVTYYFTQGSEGTGFEMGVGLSGTEF